MTIPPGLGSPRQARSGVSPAPPNRSTWDVLQLILAIVLALQVWRVHELFPVLAAPGLPVLATVAAVLAFWLDRNPRRRWSGLNQPVVRAALGILALATLSIPGSLYPRLSLDFLLKDYARSVLLMLLVAASVRGMADLRRLAWVQVAGMTLFSAVMMSRSHTSSEGRLVGLTYYDVNDLATLIVCTLPLVLYLWRRPAGQGTRVLLAAATVLLMMMLGKTGSRGGFLGFLAVTGYLLLRFKGISRARRVGAVAVLLILLATVASDAYFSRIQTILHPSADYNWGGRSETGRIEIWKRGIGYMVSHPVFGVGAAAFEIAEGTISAEARAKQRQGKSFEWSTAHNSLIQIGAELGVLGPVLFVALFVAAFRTLSRARRGPVGEATVFSQTLIASLLGFVVTAMFLSQAYSAYLYALLGMCLGLARIAFPVRARAPAAQPLFGRPVPWPGPATLSNPWPGGFSRGAR
jgi:O-antigen ligase